MKATVLTLAVVMALSSPAAAEWGLYVNRNNKAWSLERTFAFENDCKVEAHKTWKSGAVKGVACQEYAATSFARQQTAPRTTSRTPSTNYEDETVYSRPGQCFVGGGCSQVEYTRRVDSSG